MKHESLGFPGGRRETRTPDPLGVNNRVFFQELLYINIVCRVFKNKSGKKSAKTGINKTCIVTITTQCFFALFSYAAHAASFNATASTALVKSWGVYEQ